MENLIIAETKSTPEIAFDAANGLLCMKGESYPENSFDFYRPVLAWIGRFLRSGETQATLDIRLSYLNTGSTKCMMDILDLFEEAHGTGRTVKVNWFCDEDNDRAQETAEEFREEVTFPFAIIPVADVR